MQLESEFAAIVARHAPKAGPRPGSFFRLRGRGRPGFEHCVVDRRVVAVEDAAGDRDRRAAFRARLVEGPAPALVRKRPDGLRGGDRLGHRSTPHRPKGVAPRPRSTMSKT
jgi:hypothetical protein